MCWSSKDFEEIRERFPDFTLFATTTSGSLLYAKKNGKYYVPTMDNHKMVRLNCQEYDDKYGDYKFIKQCEWEGLTGKV